MIAASFGFDSLFESFALFSIQATCCSLKGNKTTLLGFWIQGVNVTGYINERWIRQFVEIAQNGLDHCHQRTLAPQWIGSELVFHQNNDPPVSRPTPPPQVPA